MSRYYFRYDGDERCYTKESIIDMMKFDGMKQQKVWEAKIVYGSDMMYCKKIGDAGEKGHCGNECEFYKPRNGKSGNCFHTGALYEPTKEVTFKL